MSISVCLVLLTTSGFLKTAFTIPLLSDDDKIVIIQEISDVDKLEIYAYPFYGGSLKNSAKTRNKQEKESNMQHWKKSPAIVWSKIKLYWY